MLHLLKIINREIEEVNNEYEGKLSSQDQAFVEGLEDVKTMIEHRGRKFLFTNKEGDYILVQGVSEESFSNTYKRISKLLNKNIYKELQIELGKNFTYEILHPIKI